jgi:hypothetical protein
MNRVTRVATLLLTVLAGAGSLTAQVPTVSRGDVAVTDHTSAERPRTGMRKLWTDHVLWTRAYIVSAVADDPSAAEAAKRLMKNQEDLGEAIVPYYGKDAGAKLTDLLKQHINIAVDLVAAAKAKDDAKVKDADQRWHANATDLATFLSGANPNWKMDDLQKMLNEHLALTTQGATARLEKNWEKDIETFDKILDQALHMADALADGITRQFPNK